MAEFTNSLECELHPRSLDSLSCPQPDEGVHKNYWVKVYKLYPEKTLIAEVSSVHVSYADDLFVAPQITFPQEITIKPGVDASYSRENLQNVISKCLVQEAHQLLEASDDSNAAYNFVIVADDI